MLIREACVDDCKAYLALLQQIEEESAFMLYESGERVQKTENQLAHWKRFLENKHSVIFLAESEKQLVGYLLFAGNEMNRQKHVAQVVIGVLSSYQRQGVGSQLMKQGKNWAEKQGLHRLELTVASQNADAISFYLRHKFVFEGIRKHSLRINGQWHNELYMAYMLGC